MHASSENVLPYSKGTTVQMTGSETRTNASTRNWLCAAACVVIFFVALGRYWVVYDSTDSVPDNPESFRLALNIADKGQFANPFVPLDTGSSAHMAPAFPGLLAFLVHVYGEKAVGIYAIKWTAAIVLCIQLALFPVFSRMLGMGELDGIVAAFLWIFAKIGLGLPPNHQAVVMFGWESFYAAILIALAACCFRRYLDTSLKGSSSLAWVLGGLAGILALVAPTAGILFAVWLAWLVWRDGLVSFKRSHIVIILLPLLFVAPWLVRNYRVFHRFIPVRDNFGLELSVSNNECAHFGIQRNMESGCFEQMHPNANLYQAMQVLEYGEPKYDNLKLQEAVRWIRHHKARFIQLSAKRFEVFWLPTESGSLFEDGRRLERFSIYAMTLLSIPGFFMLYRRDARSAAVCLCCIGLFPLVYYVIQYEYRYRYPVLWVTFLLGALPISSCIENIYRSLTTHRSVSN
jgi:hypothetical protein